MEETGEKGKDSLGVLPRETFNYEKYGSIKMEKSEKGCFLGEIWLTHFQKWRIKRPAQKILPGLKVNEW